MESSQQKLKEGFKMREGTVTVVLDAQAGSCGKGKVAGYIALQPTVNGKPRIAINNFMSNAGHTFVFDNGRSVMTQHLPTGIISEKVGMLCIGPGAAITPEILWDEIKKYSDLIGDRKIFVHPRAMVIKPEHAMKEKELVKSGSTFKGCGTAQADKIMRVPGIQLFNDIEIPMDMKEFIVVTDTGALVNEYLDMGWNILVEGSQGFDLDLNYGIEYPHVTSRQCNASQLIADCGLAPSTVDDIVMVARPYPIRISNKTNIGEDIYSGGYSSDEITWDIVRDRCGAPADVEFGEYTTVTKQLRRVFEMNWDRLKYAVAINRPTMIALNFAQYIDWEIRNKINGCDSDKVHQFIEKIEEVTNTDVMLIGTGAENQYMIDYGI